MATLVAVWEPLWWQQAGAGEEPQPCRRALVLSLRLHTRNCSSFHQTSQPCPDLCWARPSPQLCQTRLVMPTPAQ